MNRKQFNAIGILSCLCIFLLVLSCANTDDSPLQWRTSVDIPVSNQTFNIKKELDEEIDIDSLKLSDPDPIKSGDTMQFIQTKPDSTQLETRINPIDTQTYTAYIEPFPLLTTKNLLQQIPAPLPAGSFSIPISFPLEGIYYVKFTDSSVNKLPLIITNTTNQVISSMSVAITNFDTTITTSSILPNRSDTLYFDVRNKEISKIINGTLSCTLPAIASHGAISIAFSIGGLVVKKCSIDGSLMKIVQELHEKCFITDTFCLNYIDIATGCFSYTVSNYSGAKFLFNVEHRHLWKTVFCENRSIEKLQDLKKTNAIDSAQYYSGLLTAPGEMILPKSKKIVNKNIYTSSRFYTEWDDSLKKTFTRIDFSFYSTAQKGDTINLAAGDSLNFKVYTTAFNLKKCTGRMMEKYDQKPDTQKIAIAYPHAWTKATRDSLRGKLVFQNITSKIDISLGMTPGSCIDSLGINFILAANNVSSARVAIDTTVTALKNSVSKSLFLNLVNVVNAFPDTILVISKINMPRGTEIVLYNDNLKNTKDYIARMVARIKLHFSLIPKLSWDVKDSINLDLGCYNFSIVDPVRYISKLSNKSIVMNMDLYNNSNVNMTAYAICAPRKKMAVLKALSSDKFIALTSNSNLIDTLGFVNITGTKGVEIPKRSSSSSSSVSIAGSALDSLLSSDSCSIRCFVKLAKQNRVDGLTDTDYVKINSYLRVEGTNNSDSLLIW